MHLAQPERDHPPVAIRPGGPTLVGDGAEAEAPVHQQVADTVGVLAVGPAYAAPDPAALLQHRFEGEVQVDDLVRQEGLADRLHRGDVDAQEVLDVVAKLGQLLSLRRQSPGRLGQPDKRTGKLNEVGVHARTLSLRRTKLHQW
jgi:hypothetical protein